MMNTSSTSSVRKRRPSETNENQQDLFARLHQESEAKQRALVKKESEYDQKFKENHPFQPTRISKSKEESQNGVRESSKQRSERMYQQWRNKEEKIKAKREEMMREEEKMHKLQLHTHQKQRKSGKLLKVVNIYRL